ncbi:MAG: GIY-YIG nuclease family protein [Candidatus Aenigmatarchaeota archaeon]
MTYWVYMLKCYKDRKFTNFYVGDTSNILTEMSSHIENLNYKKKENKKSGPSIVRLVWSHVCKTRKEAHSLKEKIKTLSHAEKKMLCGW